MKMNSLNRSITAAAVMLSVIVGAVAQTGVSEKSVRARMEFLASDAMRGRGSGTEDELRAGAYLGSLMESYGVEPAGDKDAAGSPTFLQTVETTRTQLTSAFVRYVVNGSEVKFDHGKQIAALRVTNFFKGPLEKANIDGAPKAGSVAFVRWREGEDQQGAMQKLQSLFKAGVAGVIVEETQQWKAGWANLTSRPLSISATKGVTADSMNLIVINKQAADALSSVSDGTSIEFSGAAGEIQKRKTWNAVGKITGRDAKLKAEVILLSAHMDHLGVRQNSPGTDKIYNGADDDASGCVAVIELARVLAKSGKPRRTIYFVFFGSEEAGGFGAQYFVATLPFPKDKLVANLEFEMLGRPDDKVKPEELWLTGYERSNLGPELARRGAKLVADPHPEQNFFQRSDNYTLARQGIIAHTVSSFGLHKDYHQASDEIGTIDFKHMTYAIGSMVSPIKWLVNSNFVPGWNEGKRP